MVKWEWCGKEESVHCSVSKFLFWNSVGRAEVNLKQITWKLKYKIAIQNSCKFASIQETILC